MTVHLARPTELSSMEMNIMEKAAMRGRVLQHVTNNVHAAANIRTGRLKKSC
jgi:hypothetical protein